MENKRPEIFDYHDYQNFLTEWFNYKKTEDSKFSIRNVAKASGLAPSFISMVLSKKRVLSHTALRKLMPHIGLSVSEQSFLENIYILGTTDSAEERVEALNRMKRFQQYQKLHPRDTEVHHYLTHWYYVAIREMAVLPDFKAEPEWIQARLRFPVLLKEIEDALEFLLANGYIEKNSAGAVRPPEKSLDCTGQVYKVALGKLHRELFSLAEESIENTPSADRNILGHTCGLDKKGFNQAKEIIDEAIGRIRAISEAQRGRQYLPS